MGLARYQVDSHFSVCNIAKTKRSLGDEAIDLVNTCGNYELLLYRATARSSNFVYTVYTGLVVAYCLGG